MSGWDLIHKTSFALQWTLAHVWSSARNENETSSSIYNYTTFDLVNIFSFCSQEWILSESFFCIFNVLCVFLERFPGDWSCHSSDTWEALELPETGAVRNKCIGKDPSESLGFTFWQSRENTCGAFTVALLLMLTSQGKENSW